MGFTAGNASRGTFADVNIVPLIDILLVLLVIFLLITPAKPLGLSARIPQEAAGPVMNPPPAIVVQVLADGSVRINQEQADWDSLPARLMAIFAARAEKVAFIRGDRDALFSGIAHALDLMHSAGVESVGLLPPATPLAAPLRQ